MGRGRVYRPQGGERVRRALGYTLCLLVGLVFMTAGFLIGFDNVLARVHFADAEKVPAVVVDARYVKPEMRQSPSFISVRTTGVHDVRATIDDVFLAPDGLSPGDRVTVLYDTARPGHALFPGQLGWTKLMFPGGGLFLCGFVAAITYGIWMTKEVTGDQSRALHHRASSSPT
ncbi:DUF3592 domain-containing protein [Streptomyces sp. NPDC001068]|uniref:DUF3592 domain-containing protein n=1 Tax=Streptomyces sp. NPDC001068 TaxID=3364544 RepID=UPI003677CD7F